MIDDTIQPVSEDERERFIKSMQRSADLPDWVRRTLAAELVRLESIGQISIDSFIVDISYLEFLDQQVRLTPRGPRSSAILASRRAALTTHLGRRLGRIVVSRAQDAKGNELTVLICYIEPQSGDIVYLESDL